MKTINSSTKKELGRFFVEQAIKHVDDWSKKQFEHIRRTAKAPVCIPLSNNSWTMGVYIITQHNEHAWEVNKENNIIHTFYSKKAAILYAVYSQYGRFSFAQDLVTLDTPVANLYDKMNFYNKKLTYKKVDTFKQQLWRSRYDDTRIRYVDAIQILEKKLKSAKYIQSWENKL